MWTALPFRQRPDGCRPAVGPKPSRVIQWKAGIVAKFRSVAPICLILKCHIVPFTRQVDLAKCRSSQQQHKADERREPFPRHDVRVSYILKLSKVSFANRSLGVRSFFANPCSNEYRRKVVRLVTLDSYPYCQKSLPMTFSVSSTCSTSHGSINFSAAVSCIS